jgi:hypothetical protein
MMYQEILRTVGLLERIEGLRRKLKKSANRGNLQRDDVNKWCC